MKVMLRLAILVASLLLVANLALAAPCDQERCYNVTSTDQNDNPWSGTWRVCLYNEGTGLLKDSGAQYILRLFGGGPGWFNTSGAPGFANGGPMFNAWILHSADISYYIQPLEGGELLSAIGIGANGAFWLSTTAIKVPLSSCSVSGFD